MSAWKAIVPIVLAASFYALAQVNYPQVNEITCRIYPQVNETRPDLPSPFKSGDDQEFVVAVTREGKYAVVPVTPSNDRKICKQLIVDFEDFPSLAATGLHSETELNRIETITGRSLDEITALGRPDALSYNGFMAEDETILSVIKADNMVVRRLGLTHPQMAKPLFHLLNLMETDLELNRWNLARHRWEHIQYFIYNGRKVFVEAQDTKGGQQSIFDDGIKGGFYINVRSDLSTDETAYLNQRYGHLPPEEFAEMIQVLSSFNTGEIQPQYIMRYGFYEGHTFWRVDPISLAFIFGMKDLVEIEDVFTGELDTILTNHFTE